MLQPITGLNGDASMYGTRSLRPVIGCTGHMNVLEVTSAGKVSKTSNDHENIGARMMGDLTGEYKLIFYFTTFSTLSAIKT